MKVCATPGCPTLVKRDAYRGLCDECKRKRDRERGTTTQRGYGHEHQQERASYVTRMQRGETVRCWRCNVALTPETLHLDHTDDRTSYRGPACDACNLTMAGQTPRGRPPAGRSG